MKIPQDMQYGCIHNTKNFGKLKILEYKSALNVTVEFIDTGFVRYSASSDIRDGHVRDYKKPTVYGVGYLGFGRFKSRSNGVMTKEYSDWINMLQRCYNFYGNSCGSYTEVTVCDEWHDFQKFAEWHKNNYPDSSEDIHLDKDILSGESKQYSPETCSFICAKENVAYSNSKYWDVVTPLGEVVRVFNLKEFCKKNDLSYVCMRQIFNGVQIQHKGWKVKRQTS